MAWKNAVFFNSVKGWGEWEIFLWEDFFIELRVPKEDFDHLNLFQKLKTTFCEY